ncbi:DsbC family protein [Lysobacter capsici]|uniref:DsbC family protein n=1 Tax=Lysobacter capsici TaxID=435897 RepID=UPI001C008571|nr:DsbC family protein [Lysobacter capsici]MBW8807744.1 DsbC family protein [Lysobacter sp.]QWF16107.1 DsbC family protein [Lysobacter capsici]
MKRILFTVFGAAISLSACAQAPQGAAAARSDPARDGSATQPAKPAGTAPKVAAGSADARAIEAMRALNPSVAIDKVGPAPMPGLREVLVQGQVVYVSDDGGYVFLPGTGGALFNVKAKRNVTEDSLAGMRRDLVKTIPASERIVFAPANPKHTVTVFTDAECGYCRKLHSQIAEYNRQGIAVEYLAYPRMGLGSEDYKKMVSVWCAADRREALTAVKSDRAVQARECKNPVARQYEIGQRAGVGATGTPTILNADGFHVGGYVPPAQLRERLDKLAAESAGASRPAAAAAAPAGGV